jgi:hypothetical protein
LQMRRELLRDLDAIRVAERSATDSFASSTGGAVQIAVQKPAPADSGLEQTQSKSRPRLIRAGELKEESDRFGLPPWLLDRRSGVVAAGTLVVAAITFGIVRTHESSASNARHSAGGLATIQAARKGGLKPGQNPLAATEAKDEKPSNNAPPTSAPLRPVLTSVKFDSQPLSARVKVDDSEKAVCDTPCELPLSRGRHTFLASAAGYEETRGVIQVPEDQSKLISLSQDVKQVRLVSEPPNLPISIDGKPAGQTPLTVKLAAGKHNLTFTDTESGEAHVLDVSDEDFQHVVITRNGSSPPGAPSSGIKAPGL